MTFIPSARATHTFPSPIKQILSGPGLKHNLNTSGRFFAVRTYGPTGLLEVREAKDGSDKFRSKEHAIISREDLGDKQMVDMSFSYNGSSRQTSMLCVNTAGAVYRCTLPHGQKSMQCVYDPGASTDGTDDVFYRIARRHEDGSAYLLSDTILSTLDFRVTS